MLIAEYKRAVESWRSETPDWGRWLLMTYYMPKSDIPELLNGHMSDSWVLVLRHRPTGAQTYTDFASEFLEDQSVELVGAFAEDMRRDCETLIAGTSQEILGLFQAAS